jgi:general stress protein 26
MPTKSPAQAMLALLNLRCIASLATENDDRSIHMTAVWFVFENGAIYIATSSLSRKARNLAARAKATLMVDVRKPGKERGVTVSGTSELVADFPVTAGAFQTSDTSGSGFVTKICIFFCP